MRLMSFIEEFFQRDLLTPDSCQFILVVPAVFSRAIIAASPWHHSLAR